MGYGRGRGGEPYPGEERLTQSCAGAIVGSLRLAGVLSRRAEAAYEDGVRPRVRKLCLGGGDKHRRGLTWAAAGRRAAAVGGTTLSGTVQAACATQSYGTLTSLPEDLETPLLRLFLSNHGLPSHGLRMNTRKPEKSPQTAAGIAADQVSVADQSFATIASQELSIDGVGSLIQKIGIKTLIGELQAARSYLESEGERIQREAVRYAELI